MEKLNIHVIKCIMVFVGLDRFIEIAFLFLKNMQLNYFMVFYSSLVLSIIKDFSNMFNRP